MSSSVVDSTTTYTSCAELMGAKGAINVLTFSKDGQFLLSGGDDQCVRVWNVDSLKCEQVLHSDKWAQVTAISWIYVEPPRDENPSSVCVGTGRGSISLCPMATDRTWFLLKNAITSFPFDFNDVVEAQTYDPLNCRLAVASHSGQIKMFSVEKCIKMTLIWTARIDSAIPRGITFFGDTNQNLLIHGLETGEIDVQNANIIWTKTLAGGIGNAVLSPDETTLIVNNLTTGNFDVFQFPANTPSMHLSSTSMRRFTKQCIFGEGAKVVICGSDSNKVQVMDIVSGKCLQSLESGKDKNMIQAVAATTTSSRHLIAGGSTSDAPCIYVWEKKMTVSRAPNAAHPIQAQISHRKQAMINGLFGFLIVIISYPNWSIYFWKFVAYLSIALARSANILANLSSDTNTVQAADAFDLAKEVMKGAAEVNLKVTATQTTIIVAATQGGIEGMGMAGDTIYL